MECRRLLLNAANLASENYLFSGSYTPGLHVESKAHPPQLAKDGSDDRAKTQQLRRFGFAGLRAHLAHELTHRGDLAGRAVLGPRFEALGGVFHVR